jgi:hypothetical protein
MGLLEVAERFGDGRVRVTGRANLQVRALPERDGGLTPEVLLAIEETGLVPSRSHELVRNVVVSPQTGVAGGRAGLQVHAEALDAALCGDPVLADLPGRFLFVLDDGRGDVMARSCDLGLVALEEAEVQLRIGESWGHVLGIGDAVPALIGLARRFLEQRGTGVSAAWHVDELPVPLDEPQPADPRLPAATAPLSFGRVPGGTHVAVPDSGLDRATAEPLLTQTADEVVVTPWRGIFVPESGIA